MCSNQGLVRINFKVSSLETANSIYKEVVQNKHTNKQRTRKDLDEASI